MNSKINLILKPSISQYDLTWLLQWKLAELEIKNKILHRHTYNILFINTSWTFQSVSGYNSLRIYICMIVIFALTTYYVTWTCSCSSYYFYSILNMCTWRDPFGVFNVLFFSVSTFTIAGYKNLRLKYN